MSNNENLGVAFGLVIGAGASTAIGASVVFFPKLVKFASRRTLAGGLGLSAGVMTYVSFVEIFQKSVQAFQEVGHKDSLATALCTLCFFAGAGLVLVSAQTDPLMVKCRYVRVTHSSTLLRSRA